MKRFALFTRKVAVASMISPKETFVHYQALLEYLAAKVDIRINPIQRKTYAETNGLLGSGGVDLAFICSGPYASGRDRYHFEVINATLRELKKTPTDLHRPAPGAVSPRAERGPGTSHLRLSGKAGGPG
jgi:ABC-type phosphate/phosphonate transport system substrate-binding protein